MQKTNIDYLTHSWSPMAMRCDPVSEGCMNCWHLKMCRRMATNPRLTAERRAAYAGGMPVMVDLDGPLAGRMKGGRIIGVQFMGDLFHEGVSCAQVDDVFEVMGACEKDTFLVLT